MKKTIFSLAFGLKIIFPVLILILHFYSMQINPVFAAQEVGTGGSGGAVKADNVFGQIEAPAGVAELNKQAGKANSNIGLLIFVSNVIKVASVVAGVWVLFNFITAGFTYITATGDSGAYAKVGEKLALSVTGLLLIVAAYTIAGIIGLLIFGDATYIINPQIPTAIPMGT